MVLPILPVIINLLLLLAPAPLSISRTDDEFICAGKEISKLGHKKQLVRKRGGFVFRIYDHGKDQ